MSTYIDSIILCILCFACNQKQPMDATLFAGLLVMIALYCFALVCPQDRQRARLGIVTLILCFFEPPLSICLPWHCYLFFLHRQYVSAGLYLLPILQYMLIQSNTSVLVCLPIGILAWYLAWSNRSRQKLSDTIHALRDTSVEREMLLQKTNQQLLDSQNDQIYIATLKERNRIAREIHDHVGHMLSRSILQVGALLAICKDDTLKPHLSSLKESLDQAMNNIRSSVHDLHDESIDLQDALNSLVNTFTFCPIRFRYDIGKQVPKEVKYCFLAVTKEAMHNITRHSNASQVTLTAKEHPAFYQLLIEDNGQPAATDHNSISGTAAVADEIPVTETASDGMGLTNMRDRVEALHGILHIQNTHGFRIFVSVPK